VPKEQWFIVIAVATLVVSLLSEITFHRTAAVARGSERQTRLLEGIGRALIAAARLCALGTLVMTATFILTSG